MLLSGEAGIGKSRLVQTLKEHVSGEGAISIEFRCSAYHQNSAFYPILGHLQRILQFVPHEEPQTRLDKLQQPFAAYHFPQADTFPLLAALLSLPHPEGYPPLNLSPQKQKEKTLEALISWLVEEAEETAVYNAWEDLHWADPSTLELLHRFLDHIPTARVLVLLTCRPEFHLPWDPHSYLTQLTLSRLGHAQVEMMVKTVTGGKSLPTEVRPYFLALLAEACGEIGHAEEGLLLLTEALAAVHKTGERWCEAEVYRLYGELSLRTGEAETGRSGDKKILSDSPFPRFPVSSPEECFLKAIEIARRQQAKSLELRATMSLARLWQQQGKHHEARTTLDEICGWFTEGFDNKDWQEAKALLQEVAHV